MKAHFYIRSLSNRSLVRIFYFLVFSMFLYGCASTTPDNDSSNSPTAASVLEISLTPLSEWSEQKFAGSTDYRIIENPENGQSVLHATSDSSASLLFKQLPVDLNQTPYLNWQWKIKNTYADNLHEDQKTGDDFPARIYVAISPKLGSFRPRALNYVWASHAESQSSWKNPFTANAQLLALQSGPEQAGKWVSEKRNLKEDLSKFFGQSVESIQGIGIMTDTDNSKTSGEAEYTNLFFSRD